MPKIIAFESELDIENGYYNIKILMDIGYCTLDNYSKAFQKCNEKFSEE